MSQPQLKKDPSKLPIEQVLNSYVKSEKGIIYQAIPHKTKRGIVILRNKNKHIEASLLKVKQLIAKGEWGQINEHEWRSWVKEDNDYMGTLSQKIVKRILMTQLLIELDDELEADFEGNKYVKNILEKSKKQCERLLKDQYDTLYHTDNTYVTNFMNHIDGFAKVCSKLGVEDFVYASKLIENFYENPEEYRSEPVTFQALK